MWWRNYSQTLLKNQNWAFIWINSLKFNTVFNHMPGRRSSKDIGTIYLIKSFFKKQEEVWK